MRKHRFPYSPTGDAASVFSLVAGLTRPVSVAVGGIPQPSSSSGSSLSSLSSNSSRSSASSQSAPPAPTITSGLTTNSINKVINYQIVASGGATSYSCSGLPSGWSLNTSTGLISGTASSFNLEGTGTFPITITATNAGGSNSKTLQVTGYITPIIGASNGAVSMGGMRNGPILAGASFTIQHNPTTVTLTGLPATLSYGVNSGSGLVTVSGTLTASSGSYTFTINATNLAGTAHTTNNVVTIA